MFYIILPVYNEEDVISRLFEKIEKEMKNNFFEYRIIAINDGSTDNTLPIMKKYQAKMPIDIIDFKINKGVGEVFRSGFDYTLNLANDNDIVITMDADNTHDPALIKTMQGRINDGYDVVVASCLTSGSALIGVPFLRRVMLFSCNYLYKTIFPIDGVKEYTGFYRGYRAEIIKEASSKFGSSMIESNGFAVMAEFLIKLHRTRAKIIEAPLILRYDLKGEKSKLKVIPTIKEHFRVIFKNFFKRSIIKNEDI